MPICASLAVVDEPESLISVYLNDDVWNIFTLLFLGQKLRDKYLRFRKLIRILLFIFSICISHPFLLFEMFKRFFWSFKNSGVDTWVILHDELMPVHHVVILIRLVVEISPFILHRAALKFNLIQRVPLIIESEVSMPKSGQDILVVQECWELALFIEVVDQLFFRWAWHGENSLLVEAVINVSRVAV